MRKSLSPKQRLDMLAEQSEKCACYCGCQAEIAVRTCIGEHTVCVEWGNEDKPDRLLCVPCAKAKTRTDVKAIARAKRLARKQAGTWREPKARIRSAGFKTPPEGYKHQWPKRKLGR